MFEFSLQVGLGEPSSPPLKLRSIPTLEPLIRYFTQTIGETKIDIANGNAILYHANIVCTSLFREEEKTYYLHTRIMHSLKGYTTFKSNQILQRSDAFWQHESYDHVVRSTDELQRIIRYVINNSVKAGLVSNWQNWPWTYVH